MANQNEIIDIFEKTKTYIKGHFKLSSGNHSDTYIQVRLALSFQDVAKKIGLLMAKRFQKKRINKIVGFSVGGNILAQQLAKNLRVESVLGQIKKNDKVNFAPPSKIEDGDRILIVDDILTTEESITPIIKAIQQKNAYLLGIGIVVDRRLKEKNLGVKVTALVKLKDLTLWPPKTCPLCKNNVPFTDFHSPDSDPLSILHSLPEKQAIVMGNSYLKYYSQINQKDLIPELKSIIKPTYELRGAKNERVAILGSFDNYKEIEQIGKAVSQMGLIAISSKYIYDKIKNGKIEVTGLKHYDHESMNDFLCRMIFSCQYNIISYIREGGQFIETAWCSQANKPTLGIAYVRPWTLEKPSCKYLIGDKQIIYCNGFEALRYKQKIVGGNICTQDENKNCPLPSSQLTKMIIDIYATNPTMHLFGVGVDSEKTIPKLIYSFLSNLGYIDPKKIIKEMRHVK